MELFKSRLLSEGSIWHIGSLSAVYLSQGLSGGTLFALTTYLVSIGASVKDISLLLSITMVPWTLKVFLGPIICLLYTSPSPRDKRQSRMPSSA